MYKRQVQGALNEMNTAKQALDNYSKLSDEEKDPGIEESLYSDYQSKKSMYDAAVSESNDTVDLDRALQDTKDSLKIDEYNKELAKDVYKRQILVVIFEHFSHYKIKLIYIL